MIVDLTALFFREAEIHLPILESKEGIPISMLDMDGIHEWWFKYRYWPNNSSRMYVLEDTVWWHISLLEFVYTHGLVTDDFILVYQNVEDGRYIIEARKKGQDLAPRIFDNLAMNDAAPELEFPELPVLDDTELVLGSDSSFEAIEDYNPDDFNFGWRE
ncbi:hypothetical protein SASPL_137499 [Salvia splendens]|uniref:TF-B3 domain-containing protein n=1 Tax=Salvia splendens TaxID=180675 RepID=A0A8X8WT03_SALSN|nr:hypothetical protein SASPL_137499 [Salvia splendens]